MIIIIIIKTVILKIEKKRLKDAKYLSECPNVPATYT